MPGCRRRRRASGSCCGSRTAIRRRSRPGRSASTRWARSGSSPCPKRSARSPAAPSMSPSCCRASPGRDRSRCAPASMSCGRATRSSPPGTAASRTSMSSAADLRPDPALPQLGEVLGKGYLLPAPILPPRASGKACCCRRRWRTRKASCRSRRWSTTPMAARSARLPLGRLPRDHATALSLDEIAGGLGARPRPCRAGLRFPRRRQRRRLAARAVPLPPPRQRPCRRDQLRRACLQHDPDLPRRAAILCRPPAGPVDPAVPAARRGALRHAVPADLSGVAPVAPGQARPRSSFTTAPGAEIARASAGDSLLRLAAVPLSRVVRRGDPRPRRRRRLRDRPRPDLPAVRLSRAVGPGRRVQPRPHVRVLTGFWHRMAARPVLRRGKMLYCPVELIGFEG